jgi:hypothetical protein
MVDSYCHYNAQCAMFASQVLFSFMTMAFCMAMISQDRETQVFLPILISIVSVWMPAPAVPNRKAGAPQPVTPPPSPLVRQPVVERTVLASEIDVQ